jgi:hypothetical protein
MEPGNLDVIDFSRSFVAFSIDTQSRPSATMSHHPVVTQNYSRKPIDCVLTIEDRSQDRSLRFVLPPSCKTEVLGVDSGIFSMPNADFVPVFSDERFLGIKTYAFIGQEQEVKLAVTSEVQPDRQSGLIADVFEDVRIDIQSTPGTHLAAVDQIVEAVHDHVPLNARTTLHSERYTAVIEHPVKTINVGRREPFYQTDTGPVLLPDLSREWDDMIEGIELAYSAFNTPDWVEFVVREPTETSRGNRVYHYNRSIRWESVNEILKL